MNGKQPDTAEALLGTIVFLPANIGSKSEGMFPRLYMNQEMVVKILFKDDNPFENTTLRAYDGQRVKAFGKRKPNGTFLIEKIIPEVFTSDKNLLFNNQSDESSQTSPNTPSGDDKR